MFDVFDEHKPETPIYLAIYMCTDFLQNYKEYYIQYLHVMARPFECYMFIPDYIFPDLTLT